MIMRDVIINLFKYSGEYKHLFLIYFAYLLADYFGNVLVSEKDDNPVNINRRPVKHNEEEPVNWMLQDVLEKSQGNDYFEGSLYPRTTHNVNYKDVTLVSVLCRGNKQNVTGLLANVETVVKSLVLFSSSDIHYILVMNSDELFQELQTLLHPLLAYDRRLKPNRIIQISKRDIWYPDHYVSPCDTLYVCADSRLFLPSILHDVKKAIYVDTDFVFLQPLENLWELFEHFNVNQTLGFAFFDLDVYSMYLEHYLDEYDEKNKVVGKYHMFTPFNSGLMMIDLERLRMVEPNWSEVAHNISLFWKNREPYLCDQPMLYLYLYLNREQLFIVPCEWNFRNKIFSMNVLLPRAILAEFTSELKCNRVYKYGIGAVHLAGQAATKNHTHGYHVFQCFRKLLLDDNHYKVLRRLTDCLTSSLTDDKQYVDVNWPNQLYRDTLLKSIYDKRLRLIDENIDLCNSIISRTLF